MAQTLYIASSNPGKLRDFAAAAQVFAIDVLPLPGLKDIPAPAEDGLTFDDNARLKAVYYSAFAPDCIVIADDSGLEVDALGGEPGVRSARYAEDAEFTTDRATNLDAPAGPVPVPIVVAAYCANGLLAPPDVPQCRVCSAPLLRVP